MNRGTIISLRPLQLMPTFAAAGSGNPVFLNVYARHLQQYGIVLPYRETEGCYESWTGDRSVPGKGEIFIWNPGSTT